MTLPQLRLPGTDLTVSALCLGGNRLGGELDQAQSFELLDTFVEAGGTFIDTAEVYANWLPDAPPSCSEKMLGRWFVARGRPSHIVIATKGGHPALNNPGVRRLDKAALRRDIDNSLKNLRRGSLDLFYLHRDDPARPVADILASLEDFRRGGLVRHYAASNWSAARLREAEALAAQSGAPGFAAHQGEWSLARRNRVSAAADLNTMSADIFDWHRRTGKAAIPYSPQANGYFDKIAEGRLDEVAARAYDNDANRAMSASLEPLAAEMDATPTQVMLKALTLAPFATIPIIGCRTPGQVRASAASLALPLTPERAAALLNVNL